MKITAAILEQTNQPLRILTNISYPVLAKGQALIKINYAALCHSQLMEVRGKRGKDKYLPHMLGHEGVGEVVEIGEGVTKVSIGDSVVVGWIKGDGIEAGGTQYQSGDQIINAGAVTTFSTYAVISENRLVIKPKHLDDKVAVLLGCALPTGAGIVINQLQPERGATVVVLGLGGIGLSALLALKYFAPAQIIALDIEEGKLALANELGATKTYKTDKEGLTAFKSHFPDGVDYAIECAGTTKTIEIAFGLIKRGGKCIFASHPPSGEKISIDPYEFICGKQLIGSWGGASKPDVDIPIIADLIEKYQLPVEKLLSDEYSLEQINLALSDLEERKITRALINLTK